jgi:hypothetical protein
MIEIVWWVVIFVAAIIDVTELVWPMISLEPEWDHDAAVDPCRERSRLRLPLMVRSRSRTPPHPLRATPSERENAAQAEDVE